VVLVQLNSLLKIALLRVLLLLLMVLLDMTSMPVLLRVPFHFAGDEGVAFLVETLVAPNGPSLEVLQLSECNLGWRAGHSLARLLLANTKQIRRLSVRSSAL
jgi:hypothetical protein